MKKVLALVIALMSIININATDWFINGDATPMGWTNDGNKHRVTAFIPQGEGTFVWIGKLVVGNEGFKIGTDFSGWGDYHPSSSGLQIDIAGTDDITSGGDDTKWKVSADGVYKLTLTEGNPNTLKCEVYTPTIAQDSEGYYLLGSAEDLFEFAELVSHKGISAEANAKLTADIDYTAYPRSTIGRHSDIEWAGTFDGQGHKVKIALHDWMARTGLFSYVYHPTIKNLWIDGTIDMGNHNCAGGLGGRSDGDGTRIDGVLSTVTINDTQSGDGTLGGLFANVENNDVTISNCAFLGSINAPNRDGNGGLVGWCGSGVNITFKNCLIAPASISWNGGAIVGRNTPTVTNCYYYNISNNGDFGWAEGSTLNLTTEEYLANGQACYLLNERISGAEHWYQTLGADETPTPLSSSAKLYANGTFYCDGVTSKGGDVVLSNTDEAVVDDHVFGENGVCTGCHAVGQEAELVDGKYQINNEGNLLWWGAYVNAGHTDVNAALNADLDMTGTVYTPIGTPDNVYVGSFFGQNHSVTFALENTPYNYQGLFGIVTDGVWIERVTVKGFIKGCDYVGGIVGGTNGGSNNARQTNIWHCGNEATITASGANAAGIIGVNMSGSASIILTNCYNKGDITSGREAGALSGWLGGGWSSVRNCYNIGTVKNGDNTSYAFGRNNGCFFTNCYYTATSGTDNSTEDTGNGQPTEIADAALASGELCVKLGEDFYQLLGTDSYPVPNNSKPSVYEIAVSDAGYASFVPAVNVAAIPAGVTAYAAQKVNTWLNLEEVSELPADNAVIVKAAAGSYYYNNTDEERTLGTDNDLTFSDTDIDADGSQYVLAKPEGQEVGFYRADNGTIAARKAYITSTSSVKAFFFGGDATAINEVNGQWSMVNGESIYNLAGQRINKAQKGINIVKGKKILK